MHDDGSLIATRGVADATTVPVAFQNRFPQPTEILLILSFECVSGGTQPQRKHLGVSTGTMHYALRVGSHFPAPAAYLYRV